MENGNGISVKELGSLLEKMKKRLSVSNHSEQTIVNYLRSVEYLCNYNIINSGHGEPCNVIFRHNIN